MKARLMAAAAPSSSGAPCLVRPGSAGEGRRVPSKRRPTVGAAAPGGEHRGARRSFASRSPRRRSRSPRARRLERGAGRGSRRVSRRPRASRPARTLDLSNLSTEIKAARARCDLPLEPARRVPAQLRSPPAHRRGPAPTRRRSRRPGWRRRTATSREQEVFEAQAGLLAVSLERLDEALGGARFEGAAVDPAGS